MFEQGISGSGSGNVRNEALPEAQQVSVIKFFFLSDTDASNKLVRLSLTFTSNVTNLTYLTTHRSKCVLNADSWPWPKILRSVERTCQSQILLAFCVRALVMRNK